MGWLKPPTSEIYRKHTPGVAPQGFSFKGPRRTKKLPIVTSHCGIDHRIRLGETTVGLFSAPWWLKLGRKDLIRLMATRNLGVYKPVEGKVGSLSHDLQGEVYIQTVVGLGISESSTVENCFCSKKNTTQGGWNWSKLEFNAIGKAIFEWSRKESAVFVLVTLESPLCSDFGYHPSGFHSNVKVYFSCP